MFSSDKRKVEANYDFFSWFAYDIPGVKGMFSLLLWLLLGALLGNIVTMAFTLFLGQDAGMEYGMVVAYPLMFIPPMMVSKFKSGRNAIFDPGVNLDSSHFGKLGLLIWPCVMVATAGAGFMMDAVNSAMPPMPEWLADALTGLTGGNFWLDFLSVSIFAPLFEEWLCRGMILRGLLNYKRVAADGTVTNGMDPKWAILISAVFFGVIHMNPWQAIPAIVLGCLFGYVYYRTGSIKLTMLMHFTNNTIALLCGQIDSLSEMETWLDVLSVPAYIAIFVLFGAFIWWFVKQLSQIPMIDSRGNCDRIDAEL